jgi:serine/threonine-protein kinase
MGEVYRARDSKLHRHVAIKVLPAAFTLDRERLARFEREAQLLAQLHHPNIASVFGFEESSGVRALVMELVDGEDLSARLARGPIPLDEALPIAKQIAEALEAAHEQGIVHRDLKPANVKVRADGAVKVLDFGLAKALTPDGASAASNTAIEHSPTLTARATQLGTILGTAAYMAPEQARGKAVDRRADIWAFGVVLYEMLTGRRAFTGEDTSDVLAAVLRQEIDWSALPAATPPQLRRLLARCLDRDPKQRLRDIGEARVMLSKAESLEPSGLTAPSPAVATSSHPRFWVAVAAGSLLTGVVLGAFVTALWRGASPVPTNQPVRTLIIPATGRTLEDRQAISPDGKWIAYTAADSLWIRNLSELAPREVKGPQGARRPFWSPRSDAVAYAAQGALFKVSADGGQPVELCKITGGDFTGGSWSASLGLVFTSSRANWNGEVMRVSADGGTPEPFTQADAKKGERRLADPHFLPDGRSLLYTIVTFDSNEGEIAVERDGVRALVGLGDTSAEAVWSPSGHVVFTRNTGVDSALWALPFSLPTLKSTGEPFRIAVGGARASISAAGSLVYGLRRPDPHVLIRVDRTGRSLGVIAESRAVVSEPKFSPDGRMVSAMLNFRSVSVWETERGVETRVTGDEEPALHGSWMPGTSEIAYTRLGQAGGTWARRLDGSGSARQLLDQGALAADFSADGKYLAYYVVDPETGRDLWAKEMDKAGDGFVVLRTKANEARPRISPDGKFVAYQSDASGRWEVYVMPFPRGEGRVRVSTGGGEHATWNPKGGELFYLSGDDVMAVNVTLQPSLQAGRPQRLFGGRDVGTQLTRPRFLERFFDVAPDGRSFVVVKGHDTGTSDVVVADGLLASRR